MTRNIDDQIRAFYGQQSLPPESLTRLRSLIEKPESAPVPSVRMWQTLAVAATVALAFLAGILFVTQNPATKTAPIAGTTVASTDVTNQIAREVVMRHHNCAHTDFTATELAALGPLMTNLDFAITSPDVDMSKLKLQGAHYCVVNGRLALHASFIDQNGEAVSLLETRTSPQLASMKHAMHEIDDVEVEMWQKDDVIIAMARPIAGVA